jgi:uncharacterized protein (DUF2147 family)
MDAKHAEKIVEAGEMLDSEFKLRSDYSGRSMHGRTTAAIVCDDQADLIAACALAAGRMAQEAAEADEDEEVEDYEAFAESLRQLRFDNMGHGIVAY